LRPPAASPNEGAPAREALFMTRSGIIGAAGRMGRAIGAVLE
jgi:hypothetical protein